jgi:DNA invertase Pin-like site-specific DNA recombinase
MKVVAYLRVSTDRQAEEGLGLEVQESAIREWARTHEIVAWFRDEGLSGANGLEHRLGLADALEALKNNEARGLVVYRLDRLARDLIVQETLLAELRRIGAEAFSTSPSESSYLTDDAADPSRKLIRQVLGAVAEYERAMISLRLRSGRRRKADNGGYAFGAPPFGYRAEGRALVPVEDEQAILVRMRELRAEGATFEAIARTLSAEGRATKRGGHWHGKVVRDVLSRTSPCRSAAGDDVCHDS